MAVESDEEQLKELTTGKICKQSETTPRNCPELLAKLEANVTKYGLDLCKLPLNTAPSYIIQVRDAFLRDFYYSHEKQNRWAKNKHAKIEKAKKA